MKTQKPPPPDRYTCEDLFRKLDDYLDRALSAAEERRIREHLEMCATCAGEYRFEETLLAEVRGKLLRIDKPPDLMARISALLAREKESSGGA